jgi:hypothetical protein
LGTLKWDFEMILKTLEWSAIPLMDFKKMSSENKVGMFIPELEAGDFLKRTLISD